DDSSGGISFFPPRLLLHSVGLSRESARFLREKAAAAAARQHGLCSAKLLTVSTLLPLRPSPYSLNWERRRRFSLLNEKWKGRNCPQITVLDLVCRRLKLLIVVNVEKILDDDDEEIPIVKWRIFVLSMNLHVK
ncbi:hypothetical protein PRIPAC_72939, partial [Pristionchus pacificus]|uniref:Uncharacterized protein n=1 Tax=Pristionchus pacificus TaxID=54126 RepID=A0A2A6CAF8_PRIPA